MGVLWRLFGGLGKLPDYPQINALKCPQCSFWTVGDYFRLPREIADRIGRWGSTEEIREKWRAYGKLWTEDGYTVNLGGGRMVVIELHEWGYFDQFHIPENPECPVCGMPYSSDWPKVCVVCKKCGRNVHFNDAHLYVWCPSSSRSHKFKARDAVLKPIT